MPDVQRHNIESKLQSCSANNEVFDRNGNPLGRLLAFDAPRKLRDLQRQWVDNDRAEEFFGKIFPALAVNACQGAIDPMRQFYRSDRRDCSRSFSTDTFDTLENLPHSIPASLACDQNARIEDQAQAVSPISKYRGACGCG